MNKDVLTIVALSAWGLVVLVNILLIAYGIFTGENEHIETYSSENDIEKDK